MSEPAVPGPGSAGRRIGARAIVARALVTVAVLVGTVATVGAAWCQVAWSQEGPADPVVVREDVREVMSRPEFSYEPSFMERIGNWIADQLDKLFPEAPGAGSGFGGGVGSLVGWILIVAAVVAAAVVIVVVVRNRVKVPARERAATESEVEHRRKAHQWARDAAAFEAEGRWKEALRARYRELVRTLVDRRQLPDIPGRTTGELRADLSVTTRAAALPFDRASLLFELAWYADVHTGADENREFRRLADAVLEVAGRDRFDLADTVSAGGVVEVHP